MEREKNFSHQSSKDHPNFPSLNPAPISHHQTDSSLPFPHSLMLRAPMDYPSSSTSHFPHREPPPVHSESFSPRQHQQHPVLPSLNELMRETSFNPGPVPHSPLKFSPHHNVPSLAAPSPVHPLTTGPPPMYAPMHNLPPQSMTPPHYNPYAMQAPSHPHTDPRYSGYQHPQDYQHYQHPNISPQHSPRDHRAMYMQSYTRAHTPTEATTSNAPSYPANMGISLEKPDLLQQALAISESLQNNVKNYLEVSTNSEVGVPPRIPSTGEKPHPPFNPMLKRRPGDEPPRVHPQPSHGAVTPGPPGPPGPPKPPSKQAPMFTMEELSLFKTDDIVAGLQKLSEGMKPETYDAYGKFKKPDEFSSVTAKTPAMTDTATRMPPPLPPFPNLPPPGMPSPPQPPPSSMMLPPPFPQLPQPHQTTTTASPLSVQSLLSPP